MSAGGPALRPPEGVWLRSFVYAATGLRRAWRSERNVRVQAAAGWAALAAARFAGLSGARVAALLAAIAAVLGAEIMNSAVEAAVDLAAPGPHALAAAAKDLAAGAVLCLSLGAVAVGMAAFWPLPAAVAHVLAGGRAHPLQAVLAVLLLGCGVTAAAARLPGRRRRFAA